ncbi:MAG: D-alanyl-D-alanine carboxypeptidase family protein [Acutalibacteraceae bacterium]|nr:D-alanyl-D-alanine carboxypeptidase family protein [Acutalibacteraceae bacterium]
MKRVVCFVSVFCIFAFSLSTKAISTSAKASILINADTGEVIYSQNQNEKLPMASTTKIMTALLLCEEGNMEKGITVTPQMVKVEGTSMGLLGGDKVTYKALLYGMLLASGNDAANVTAYALGGTIDGFVNMMNQRAKELGLNNTHFETPSGLDGDEHYTTAEDLANLARVCMDNPLFKEAASTKAITLEYGNPPYRRTLTNHNKLLKIFEGAVGVKTGFTKKAGRCLVSCAEREGKRVIAVTLKDPNDWEDHINLLNYGLEKVKTTVITPEKTDFSISVISSQNQSVEVKIEEYTVSSLDTSGFSCEVNLPTFLYAPVKEGEVIGSVVYYKDNTEIDRQDIKSPQSIEKITPQKGFGEKYKESFKSIFMSIWEK